MTVASADASIFDEQEQSWITIAKWLSQFGEFKPIMHSFGPFVDATIWQVSPGEAVDEVLEAFASLPEESKKGTILRVIGKHGFCINTADKVFSVDAESSSIIENFKFIQEEKKIAYTIRPVGNEGFIQSTIPQELLSGEFAVVLDGNREDFDMQSNATHAIISVKYGGNARQVEVTGTNVIPEFTYVPLILLAGIASLILIVRLRKKGNPNAITHRDGFGIIMSAF